MPKQRFNAENKNTIYLQLPSSLWRDKLDRVQTFVSLHWPALLGSADAPAFRFHTHTAPPAVHECAVRKRVWRGWDLSKFLWNKQLQREMGCFCCHAKHYAFLKTVNKLEIFHGINMISVILPAYPQHTWCVKIFSLTSANAHPHEARYYTRHQLPDKILNILNYIQLNAI